MINKIAHNILEALFGSVRVRRAVSFLYRLLFFYEYPAIFIFCQKNSSKRIIAVNAYETYQFHHLQPVYRSLVQDPANSVILIGSNPKKLKAETNKIFFDQNHLIVNVNIFSYIWLPLLRPNIFLDTATTPQHQLCPRKTVTMLFAHGLSSLGFSKNHAEIKDAVTYDYIIATGPYQEKALKLAAEKYKVRLPEIIRGGFIRGDTLAEKGRAFDRRAFSKKCGLPDRKTLLFAPTWGEFSVAAEWIDPIAEASHELDCNLLIKLHPLMLEGTTQWETAGVDWKAKLAQLGSRKNIHICNTYELEDYMLAADIMITDASSVGIEFFLLRRPVIFLPAPQYFDTFGRDKPIYWLREGLEIAEISGLKEKIKAINPDSGPAADYDLESIIYNPGNAVASICSFLRNIGGQRPADS